MVESSRVDSPSFSSPPHSDLHIPIKTTIKTKSRLWLLRAFFAVSIPVVLALVLRRLDPFEPVQFLVNELTRAHNSGGVGVEAEFVGVGELNGPEDLIYDEKEGVIYTGCDDGWIKRVTANDSVDDSVVENWVNTGGRPLGMAFGNNGEVLVADGNKGLLRVSKRGKIELLADEVEGLKFKLCDGVAVARDGTIYFTDASYKYSLKDYLLDIKEGKPHGRFMSYDPKKNKTTLIARNLFFANGVAVSPDQRFVVFCETVKRRCRRYYIDGPKKGRIGKFCEDLPGMPDNIHYVGFGHFYIGMATPIVTEWNVALRYPFIQKAAAMVANYMGRPITEKKNGGVLSVNLAGIKFAHYYDPLLSLITSGIKIGDHIYCGSLMYPFIVRVDRKRFPPNTTTTTLSSSTN